MNQAKLIESKSEQTCLELHLKGIGRFHRTVPYSLEITISFGLEPGAANRQQAVQRTPVLFIRPIDGIRMH